MKYECLDLNLMQHFSEYTLSPVVTQEVTPEITKLLSSKNLCDDDWYTITYDNTVGY